MLALNYASLTLCVIIYSVHVFITTIVSALRGAKILVQEWIALAAAFLGVIWFCSVANANRATAEHENVEAHHNHNDEEEGNPLMTGIALSLLAAVMYSFQNILNSTGKVGATGGAFSFPTTGLVFTLMNTELDTKWLWGRDVKKMFTQTVPYLVFIGFADLAGKCCFIYAYSNEAPNKIGLLEYLEIIFEGIFDSVLFGTRLSLQEYTSAFIIIGSSAYVNLFIKKE